MQPDQFYPYDYHKIFDKNSDLARGKPRDPHPSDLARRNF